MALTPRPEGMTKYLPKRFRERDPRRRRRSQPAEMSDASTKINVRPDTASAVIDADPFRPVRPDAFDGGKEFVLEIVVAVPVPARRSLFLIRFQRKMDLAVGIGVDDFLHVRIADGQGHPFQTVHFAFAVEPIRLRPRSALDRRQNLPACRPHLAAGDDPP